MAKYYTTRINPPRCRGEIFEYYKALNKEQIIKHAKNNGWEVLEIYDPIEKPIHGEHYDDITCVFVDDNK